MKEKPTPYVVSNDLITLMTRWSRKNNFTIPNKDYFAGVQSELLSILETLFPNVETVPEDFLVEGLRSLVSTSPTPVISLDRVYLGSQDMKNVASFLDVTRTVDTSLNNLGLSSRNNQESIETQIEKLALGYRGKRVALADDVIFEGRTILQVVQLLRNKGVLVEKIYAGIAILEGIELLAQNDLDVYPLLTYESVIDEICERDFWLGAPLSGRTVQTAIGTEGAPYIYPFGKPVEWASIPSVSALDFSFFCLYQALQLWKEIEKKSKQEISTLQLDKPIFNLPRGKSMSVAIKNVLRDLDKDLYEF